MRKMCKALALTLCTVMLLSTLTVIGDPGGKTVLTLEEAKTIALKNDTMYKLQQSYIEQKAEDLEDIYDSEPRGIFRTKDALAAAQIANDMSIENAALAYKKEVFKRNDLKRKSDFDVTMAYYDVMKSKLALDDAKRSMDLAKKELDVANIELEYGLITKNFLAQIENAYISSQTAYNKALTDVQNNMAALSKDISKDLDFFTDEVDMTIGSPDIKSLDLEKIKKDFMDKNESYFLSREQLNLVKYKQDLTEEKYEDYLENHKGSRNSDTRKAFDDMIYEANRDYNNAKYQYDESIRSLDITLNTQYTGINTLAEAIENLKKSIADARTTLSHNKTKYDLGMISRNDFEKSESSLKDMENQLATSIINLNTQYLSLTQYSYIPVK